MDDRPAEAQVLSHVRQLLRRPGVIREAEIAALDGNSRKGPHGDALAGAVFGYFMLALTWAQLYAAALAMDPGAIAVPGETPLGSDLVYFSLVTVTTLGYGDVLPVSPMARILAATEAVVGALYVAVLIGRIVSDLKPGGDAAR